MTTGRRRRALRIATAVLALGTAIAVSYFAHRAANDAPLVEPAASARAGGTAATAPTSSSAAIKRYAVQGPSTKANPFVARQEALKERIEFRMIEALQPVAPRPDAGRP